MGTVKYTGPVASFHCPTNAEIRSLKVHFSPKQNLNGQTKPWPAGGGKNILNMDWFIATNSYISSTGATGTMAYYSYTDYLELAPNTYTISGVNNTVNSNLRIHSYDENKEWVKQLASKYLAEGASFSLTFTVTSDDKYIRISAPAKTPANSYLQLEVGSSATEYEPYENICPIEGWDGVTVHNDDGIVVPEEYRKVEYLESTGTQWFWTDVDVQDGLTVESTSTYAPSQDSYLFGGAASSKNDRLCFNGTYGGNLQCAYPSGWFYAGTVVQDNKTIHKVITTFVNNTAVVSINGVATFNSNRAGELPINTGEKCVCFGARSSAGTANFFYKGKVYKLCVKKNLEVLANFIPCRRKSDNKPGMYDTVSGQFFTNQGTGEFICGPDVGQTTNYEFGVLGKNKFDKSTVIDYCRINGSGEIVAQSGMSISDYIPVVPGQQYTITTTGNISANKRHAYYDQNKQYLRVLPDNPTTITIPQNARYIRLTLYNNALDTTQFELGSSATAYEPYNPNHTVYGGWVDLISGEVCEEWINFPFTSSLNWNKANRNSSGVYFYYENGKAGERCLWSAGQYLLINAREKYTHGKIENPWSEVGNNAWAYWATNNTTIRLSFSDDMNILSVDDLKNWLDEQGNVYICYPLATPNTYHISPITLQTFLGQNNIWSNADYVEVEYDLHETQTILERKAFILANQAKIKTASGSPATFTTTTHAPLKSAKVYFTPVQTGSGAPSPTNVRPILGWKQAGLVINRGKNLMNEAALVPNTGIDASGTNRTWTTTKANDFLYLPPGDYILTGTYTGSDTSANLRVHGYTHDQQWAKQITYQAKGPNESYSIPFTMTADIPYMRFSANKDVTNIQLEAGSAATTYEAFSGRELSVNWGDVIYGGYVDLISGEVWKTYGYYSNITAFTGAFGPIAYGYAVYLTFYDGDHNIKTPICDRFMYSAAGYTSMPAYSFGGSSGANITFTFILDSTITSKAEADAWLANNPISISYGLATPQLVTTLTPSQLSDFVRTNIVTPYSNSNVEVQYWTH